MIRINDQLSIPENEIIFEVSTSSGPGGQHVNRVQTRVTLTFDLGASKAVSGLDRERLRSKLGSRINKAGQLQVGSERHRSQRMNRKDAIEKFAALIAEALEPEVPRKKTHASKTVKARRLDEKKRRSAVKQNRRKPEPDDS